MVGFKIAMSVMLAFMVTLLGLGVVSTILDTVFTHDEADGCLMISTMILSFFMYPIVSKTLI